MIGEEFGDDVDTVGGYISGCNQQVEKDRESIGGLLFVSNGI